MGFRFRKSVSFGPLRVNLSKSGVGWSVGGRGFRTGQRADGKRYTSLGLPGTGISHHTEHGRRTPAASGCAVWIAAIGGTLLGTLFLA